MKAPPRSLCPISLALDLVGDSWSLIVVRDLMFKNISSFNGFLNAGEGIASNVLSERLARLEAGGIILREKDPSDGRRYIYRLTAKGADLAPVLVSLVLWSAKHTQTDAPAELVAAMASDPQGFAARVAAACRGEGGGDP